MSRPCYIGHPVSNKLRYCYCWYDFLSLLHDYHSHIHKILYRHVLVQYDTCHSWHPVLLPNLIHILPLLLLLLAIGMTWHDLTTDIPLLKSPFSVTLSVPKNHPNLRLCATLCSMLNYFCLAVNCQPDQSLNGRHTICQLSMTTYLVYYSENPSFPGDCCFHPQPESALCHFDKGST
jgi:hypothetical protein